MVGTVFNVYLYDLSMLRHPTRNILPRPKKKKAVSFWYIRVTMVGKTEYSEVSNHINSIYTFINLREHECADLFDYASESEPKQVAKQSL